MSEDAIIKAYGPDEKDSQLLDLLQRDARRSVQTLGDKIGLAAPAVQRRIRRMRDAGVTMGEVAVVDPVTVGLLMTVIVTVELEREHGEQLDAFRRKVVEEARVQQCYHVTGEGNFVLVALASSMDDYEALTRRLFFDDANVRRFRTSVVVGRSFRSLTVPAVDAPC